MTIDGTARSREAHRLLAFVYFTCADADATWNNQETVALYEFLELQAGDLGREQSVALAQDAYREYLALADADARMTWISARLPAALGHLSQVERGALLEALIAVARADGRVTVGESYTVSRVRRLLQDTPVDSQPDLHEVRDEELRLLAFIYFSFASADGAWTNAETVALFDFLEARVGPGDRERTVELAREAHQALLAEAAEESRVRWISERAPRVLAHRDVAARKTILHDLVTLARADGKFSPAEGHHLEAIRQILL
jgi:uncharacterized tellurite resistance protein B-like protein